MKFLQKFHLENILFCQFNYYGDIQHHSDWYKATQADFSRAGGSGLLSHYSSLFRLFSTLFPTYLSFHSTSSCVLFMGCNEIQKGGTSSSWWTLENSSKPTWIYGQTCKEDAYPRSSSFHHAIVCSSWNVHVCNTFICTRNLLRLYSFTTKIKSFCLQLMNEFLALLEQPSSLRFSWRKNQTYLKE